MGRCCTNCWHDDRQRGRRLPRTSRFLFQLASLQTHDHDPTRRLPRLAVTATLAGCSLTRLIYVDRQVCKSAPLVCKLEECPNLKREHGIRSTRWRGCKKVREGEGEGCQLARDTRKHFLPVAAIALPEQPHRRVPGAVVAGCASSASPARRARAATPAHPARPPDARSPCRW
jgi:hypothetical protein